MGVFSALRLRIAEGGLLDNDYKILLDDTERRKRIRQYFAILKNLETNPEGKVEQSPSEVFDRMSGKKTRLWYITGCHIAQEIEKRQGTETLRKLVKMGSADFFNVYSEIEGY